MEMFTLLQKLRNAKCLCNHHILVTFITSYTMSLLVCVKHAKPPSQVLCSGTADTHANCRFSLLTKNYFMGMDTPLKGNYSDKFASIITRELLLKVRICSLWEQSSFSLREQHPVSSSRVECKTVVTQTYF